MPFVMAQCKLLKQELIASTGAKNSWSAWLERYKDIIQIYQKFLFYLARLQHCLFNFFGFLKYKHGFIYFTRAGERTVCYFPSHIKTLNYNSRKYPKEGKKQLHLALYFPIFFREYLPDFHFIAKGKTCCILLEDITMIDFHPNFHFIVQKRKGMKRVKSVSRTCPEPTGVFILLLYAMSRQVLFINQCNWGKSEFCPIWGFLLAEFLTCWCPDFCLSSFVAKAGSL